MKLTRDNFYIEKARESDIPVIYNFIQRLAEYEKLSDKVSLTYQDIRETLFGKQKKAYVLIAYLSEKPVGFAVYFYNYSTFLGKYGLYLEDLFVLPEKRGMGIGKAMLSFLARIAVEKKCGRFEWSVLNWNKTAIQFYQKLGAVPMSEWTVYRLSGEKLRQLAGVD